MFDKQDTRFTLEEKWKDTHSSKETKNEKETFFEFNHFLLISLCYGLFINIFTYLRDGYEKVVDIILTRKAIYIYLTYNTHDI